MSGHTPGPWTSHGIYVFGAENIVAKCEYSASDFKDTRANARLVAGAMPPPAYDPDSNRPHAVAAMRAASSPSGSTSTFFG